MSTWYRKDIGDGLEALGPSSKVQDAFDAFFVAAGMPESMGVFASAQWDETGVGGRSRKVHTLYFPPEAERLATAFDATACDKPHAEGIGLLVGDQRALSIHFPDRRR